MQSSLSLTQQTSKFNSEKGLPTYFSQMEKNQSSKKKKKKPRKIWLWFLPYKILKYKLSLIIKYIKKFFSLGERSVLLYFILTFYSKRGKGILCKMFPEPTWPVWKKDRPTWKRTTSVNNNNLNCPRWNRKGLGKSAVLLT